MLLKLEPQRLRCVKVDDDLVGRSHHAVLVLLLRVKKTKRKLEKGADFLAVENQGVRLASRAEEQAGGA